MGYYLPPLPLLGCCVVSFDLYWQDNFLNNKIQSDKDNFLDNLIYEIAIMGVLGSIFRQDNFLTIYERFWHLGGHVKTKMSQTLQSPLAEFVTTNLEDFCDLVPDKIA